MSNFVSKVNPLQGTASDRDYSTGNTLPIAARPFGMHHWTLQTAPGNWFFHPAHQKIWGIRLTHQPSPWMGDYGSLLITPFTGPVTGAIEEQSSAYKRTACHPHFLAWEAMRYRINTEMAPTEHGAIFVFTAEGTEAIKLRLHFDKGHTLEEASGRKDFAGCSRDFTYAAPDGFALYFAGEFSETPQQFELLSDGGYWTFPPAVRRVEFRLAGSFISVAMARHSCERELKPAGLEEVKAAGAGDWNSLLGRIAIEARDENQERTFYSCLYRCLLFPRLLDEVDEQGTIVHNSPYDGGVHSGHLCTDNGFWDTHRTVYSLLALFYPDKLKIILEGWLNASRQAGWTPKWASPGLRDCMIGTHFDVVVADAVARGVTDWDVESAFAYLWKNATVPSDNGAYGRRELAEYLRLGYVPADKFPYAVSCTLDYAYNDFCVGQVARFLGRHREADLLQPRKLSYRNVFDPSVGFMRERLADGQWKTPFDEFRWGGGYIEGSAWQHTLNVPHDTEGLAALFGGSAQLCQKLDALLATPPHFHAGHYGFEIHEMTEMAMAGFGQYAHSNQPVHGFLFLYALHGQPEKTSHWVRKVAEELYSPNNLPGDEDNGEMGAWYVWATLGLYPHCPGKNEYTRFTPLARTLNPLPPIGGGENPPDDRSFSMKAPTFLERPL
jgi:putative alpha-1,2-mannosidase